MPSSSSLRRADTRRALIADLTTDRKGWLKHGIAALAISVLGLGVAASVSLTGSASQNTAPVAKSVAVKAPGPTNPELANQAPARGSWDAAKLSSLADQRAEELAEASAEYATAASSKSAQERDKALESGAAATREQAERLADEHASTTGGGAGVPAETDAGAVQSNGRGCMPITGGYRIAARWGQVGIWSRYHTGVDLSAGVGTPIHAPAAGVVTTAGLGRASGWAGNYVVIKYPDGTSTLMAHMSTVSVSVGQTVSACQVVGAVGLTGRTFGPHLHFEAYPAGVTAGDIYSSVNPENWLSALGLNL